MRILSAFAATAVLLAVAVPAAATAAPRTEATQIQPSGALGLPRLASLEGFDPGNIIDDGVFFNAATMTEAEVQRFLEVRVPRCSSGYTCLKDWRDTSRTVPADAMCAAYAGASDERASRIIYKVAQACGINPQVILATLEKEQSLVTHTWPSTSRYTIAMGQGCPDTAACDTRYYGFFNQVYGAAWQFKRYANPPGTSRYFTWYAPGRTWNIRYNPEISCGSSPVFISNQATANLYYYTPYQPNAAALAAGRGVGDACSAHGNRNFYNNFTDWFGTTRGSGVVLARTSADPAVYLLSGAQRWHVVDGDDLASLSSVFGRVYTVSDTYLQGFSRAGQTGAILRDEATGEIAYFQEGQRHRLASCDLVARWGGSCSAPITISSALFGQGKSGAEMTTFYRVRGSSKWGRLESSSAVTPMWNDAAVRSANGDPAVAVYGAYISDSSLAAKKKNPLLFAPAQVVKSTGSDKVYLTIDQSTLVWIRSWRDVAEFNRYASNMAVVPDVDLFGRYRETGEVRPMIRCEGTTYFPGSGVLYPLADASRTGLTIMDAGAATCAQFTRGPIMGAAALIKVNGRSAIAAVEAGTRRVAVSWNALTTFVGSAPSTFATVSAGTYDAYPAGAPIADGEIVKGSAPALSLVSGTTAIGIPSYDLSRDAGLNMSFATVGDGDLAGLTSSGSRLGVWLSCGGTTYAVGSGGLTAVSASAAQGFSVPELSRAACGRFVVRSGTLPVVLVKSAAGDEVLLASGGVYRHVLSWSTVVDLSKGAPNILTLSASTVASLPQGPPLP